MDGQQNQQGIQQGNQQGNQQGVESGGEVCAAQVLRNGERRALCTTTLEQVGAGAAARELRGDARACEGSEECCAARGEQREDVEER